MNVPLLAAAALIAAEPGGMAQPGINPPADDPPPATGEIIVYGRGEHRIGTAAASSEGAVAGADLSVRPLLRPAEILEAVPGLIATQHSGGGKANQYFLRGFNLDHGTDFALTIDDMPMNFRTHGHGQGYLDVGGLIPEVVKRIEYRKGPYRADAGDFSFVGMSQITTQDRMEPFATLEYGGYGYRRIVGGGSFDLAGGTLLFAGQGKLYDGPWELPEDMKSLVGLVKYSKSIGSLTFRISLNAYHASWHPTEQIPARAIGTLLRNAYGTLDPFLTGRTDRQILTAGLYGDSWRATAWAQHYDWSLFSNFTFYLDDPVAGDELRQYEKMWGYGGRLEKTFRAGSTFKLTLGAEGRGDEIGQVGLDHSAMGVVDFTRNRFKVTELSAALYAEAVWTPNDRLMVIGGLRGDSYRFQTTALAGGAWSGKASASILSPKFGLNFRLADGLAVYANYGQGFHSNDARGITSPVNPAPGLVKGNFRELGVRFERGSLVLTANYWWSRIASELIYVGDSGAVEPSGAGQRHGFELTGFVRLNGWLAVDAVWTGTTSRYVDLPVGANFIPGALKNSGELGLSAIFDRWNAAVRVRHLGPHALIEDGSALGEATTLVNLRAACTLGKFEVYAELLNALDSKAHDVDYFYATRLPGEPAGGVEDFNSRRVEPRQMRLGLKMRF